MEAGRRRSRGLRLVQTGAGAPSAPPRGLKSQPIRVELPSETSSCCRQRPQSGGQRSLMRGNAPVDTWGVK